MAPIHTLLHPTDFSAQSGYALQLAGSIARDYGARLVVLHVAERPTITYAEGVMLPPTVEEDDALARAELNRLGSPRKASAPNAASRRATPSRRSCASPRRSTPT